MIRKSVCALVVALCAGSVFGSAPQAGVLKLRTGVVPVRTLNRANLRGVIDLARRHVITLDGPMTPQRQSALRNAGVVLWDYLPEFSYIADLSGADAAKIRACEFVVGITPFDRTWKLDPSITGDERRLSPALAALAGQGLAAVEVYLFADTPADEAQKRIEAIPGAMIHYSEFETDRMHLSVSLPFGRLDDLTAIDDVQFVEQAVEFTTRSNTIRWIVQSNIAGVTPLYDAGLTGQGRIIGLIDQAVSVGHCAFSDPEGDPVGPNHRKIQAYHVSLGNSDHGTSVASILLGDGGAFDNKRGVAYNARLTYNTFPSFGEASMVDRFETAAADGAMTHSNSWGNDFSEDYNGTVRGVDSFLWNNDEHLVCFAVSNDDVIHIPENAKNSLAVSATGNSGSQEFWCDGGVGPTTDGRRKPDIMAPGCDTWSAGGATGCNARLDSGTSFACPSVAAIGELTREYFLRGFYPSGAANASDAMSPSGALIKAVLLNSAQRMLGGTGFPSNLEGWGRLLADNALHFAGESRTLFVDQAFNGTLEALTTGEMVEHTLGVMSGAELRVTLAFYDAPGALNSLTPVVNNLDLVVVSPSGQIFVGNKFQNNYSVGGGPADTLNSVEQVRVQSPATGNWKVQIWGTAVNSGQQGYGLAVSGRVLQAAFCTADINHDGVINGLDVGAFLDSYFNHTSPSDLNGDGIHNGIDVGLFLQHYFEGC